MCQSKANGGRRCEFSTHTRKKITQLENQAKEFIQNGRTVPPLLDNKLDSLYVAADKHEAEIAIVDEAKKQKLAIREAQKQEKEAKKAEKEAKSRYYSGSGRTEEVKIHFTEIEKAEILGAAKTSELARLKEEGTATQWAEIAVKAHVETAKFVSYDDYLANTDNGSIESYLDVNKVSFLDACKSNRTRPYDSLRQKIAGIPTITKTGENYVNGGANSSEALIRMEHPGRRPSTFGTEQQGLNRVATVRLNLDKDTLVRADRIAQVMDIKRSDAIRCLALGIDPYKYQQHMSVNSFNKRMAKIKLFETVGFGLRLEGESREDFYTRLINDPTISVERN